MIRRHKEAFSVVRGAEKDETSSDEETEEDQDDEPLPLALVTNEDIRTLDVCSFPR